MSIYYKEPLLKIVDSFYENCIDNEIINLINESVRRDGVNPTISADIAKVLSFFVKIAKPKKILELGTSLGVSATIFAKESSDDAIVYTIENDSELLGEALNNFERFGVDKKVIPILGDIRFVVPEKFKDSKFDFIFQDASKKLYYELFPLLSDMLNIGGYLITDDVLFSEALFPEYLSDIPKYVAKFNETIKKDSRFDSILIPLGDGIMISRKISK